ncbi:GDSL-type esterase/lipase family protein [Treponema sp.]|uniref:GDSL-type esterase/lipase family protein n=1 Tax=Treponema sp. TaxID=166 RepID=UPI00388D60DE
MKKTFSIIAVSSLLFAQMFISCSDSADSTPQSNSESVVNQNNVSAGSYTFETPDETYTFSLTETALEGKSVTWATQNPYIVNFLDDNGTIVALSGGKTTVTATADGTTLSFDVEVSEPNREATSDPFDAKTVSGDIEIITCGDSIMRDYGASETDQYGLGQAFAQFFDESKTTVTTSISNGGRSSRLFHNESTRWPVVVEKLKENQAANKPTFVFLSFGHNDERYVYEKNADGGYQFTFADSNQNDTVAGTFYDYMERYIVETRELGGIPVLISPLARAYFKGTATINQAGRHNIETAYASRTYGSVTYDAETKARGNYTAAMQAVAEKHNAIYVDLTNLSADYCEQFGETVTMSYLYVDGDQTHERTLGGLRFAEIVVNKLKEAGVLTNYIKTPDARVMVNKGSLAFGRLYPQASKTLSFKVSSFNATSGTVTVTAPDGYTVSLEEDGDFTSSVEIDLDSDFVGTEVFVKFCPSEVAEYNANLTVTHTSITPDFGNTIAGTIDGSALLIALTGAGKARTTSGTSVTVLWPMIDSSNKYNAEPTVSPEGEVGAENVKLSGLVSTSSVKRGTSKDGAYMARVNSTDGSWPVNDSGTKIDDVYMQFEVPVTGCTFTVNKISMTCGSSGSGNMKWSIYYSTDADFSNPTPIGDIPDGVTSNGEYKDIDSGDESLGLDVGDGESLYIRIYPAFKTNTTVDAGGGRCFMMENIQVEGLTN